ncbi:MAG: TonB-dependent receptor plug domain-containing protein, partial [Salibacteraceae bacterium]
MRISSVFIFLMCLNFAQGAEVKGIVVDDGGNPIPFVQVMISGTSIGAETDTNGVFHLSNVPEGNHEIQYSAMGYQRLNRSVSIADKGMVDVGTIKLKLDMLGLNEVVITGTMRETFVKASPVKVEVMKMEHVTKNIPATNLMEGLKLINGVQEVSACGVCNTSSISINGLPGQYSAILLDGSPIYGSLASVYGLNGIPTQMVDRIEIIKGPSSTLYGSEAIAG